jgi:hypothetical protein
MELLSSTMVIALSNDTTIHSSLSGLYYACDVALSNIDTLQCLTIPLKSSSFFAQRFETFQAIHDAVAQQVLPPAVACHLKAP